MTERVTEITLRELIDAMEKNGWKKARGTFFRNAKRHSINSDFVKRDQVVYACAIGQAALNLGVTPPMIGFSGDTLGKIAKKNDTTGMTVPEIAQWAREEFKDQLDLKKYRVYRLIP